MEHHCTTLVTTFSERVDGRWVHNWPSNFYVEPDGTFVEAEYQAEKTNGLRSKVEILTCDTPGEAKRLGRHVSLRSDWESVKVDIMRSLVLRKFLDHPALAADLSATLDEPLVESNTWHDNFWGNCTCQRCEGEQGRNALKEILVEVRDLILNW